MPNFNQQSVNNVFGQNPFGTGGMQGVPTTQGFGQSFGGGGGGGASLFGLNMPQTFLVGQGLGLLGDIFGSIGQGGRRKRAQANVNRSLTGLEDTAGQQPFDPFQVASFASLPVRQQAREQGEFLQEVSGNVFAPDVQGALFEQFAPQFASIFGQAKQRSGEIQLSNQMQASLARLNAMLQAQQLEFA